MATTLEQILTPEGGSGRPKTAATPFDSSLGGAATPQPAQPQSGGTATQPNEAVTQPSTMAGQPNGGNPATTPASPQSSTPQAPYWDWSTGKMVEREQPQNVTVPYEPGKEPTVSSSTQTDAGVDNAGQKPARLSYTQMYQQLNPFKPPTEEELEKERKKQKREQIFAAIGDGISSLANLFFTTKGASNMYTGQNTQSKQVKDRWEKLKADRDAHMKEYMDGLMKAQALDDDKDDKDRTYMEKLTNNYRNYLLKKAADDRAAALHDLDKQLQQGKIDEQTHKAKKAEVEAKYAAELQQSQIDKNKAAAGASKASATASYAAAGKSNAEAEETRNGGKPYATFCGKTYRTKADYDKAVLKYARRNNIPITYDKQNIRTSGTHSKKTTTQKTQTNRTISGIAAQAEEHWRMSQQNSGGNTSGRPSPTGSNGGRPSPTKTK